MFDLTWCGLSGGRRGQRWGLEQRIEDGRAVGGRQRGRGVVGGAKIYFPYFSHFFKIIFSPCHPHPRRAASRCVAKIGVVVVSGPANYFSQYICFLICLVLFHQSYPDPPRLPSLLMLEKGSDLRRKSRSPDVNLVSKNGLKVCCCPM